MVEPFDVTVSLMSSSFFRTQINSGRYNKKEDFTVVIQPFIKLFNAPLDKNRQFEEVIDISYVTYDCFHFSQKGHALGKNAPTRIDVGKSSRRLFCERVFVRGPCPRSLFINRRNVFLSHSCQFAMEQYDAARRYEIRDLDGLHHETIRLSDGPQPVHIYCQQFGAITLSEQQTQMNRVSFQYYWYKQNIDSMNLYIILYIIFYYCRGFFFFCQCLLFFFFFKRRKSKP